MTHDDFIDVEHSAGRALRAIGQVAEPGLSKRLRHAQYLLAELRCAAQWMCDPAASEESKSAAMERLAGVFKHAPN